MGVKFVAQCTEEERTEICNCLTQLFQLVKRLHASKISVKWINAPGYPIPPLFEWQRKATTVKGTERISELVQQLPNKEKETQSAMKLSNRKSDEGTEYMPRLVQTKDTELSPPRMIRTSNALDEPCASCATSTFSNPGETKFSWAMSLPQTRSLTKTLPDNGPQPIIDKISEPKLIRTMSNLEEPVYTSLENTVSLSLEKKVLSDMRLRNFHLNEQNAVVCECTQKPIYQFRSPRLEPKTSTPVKSHIPFQDPSRTVKQKRESSEVNFEYIPRYTSEKVIRSTSVENLTLPGNETNDDVVITQAVHSRDLEFGKNKIRNLYFTVLDSGLEYYVQVKRHHSLSDISSSLTDISCTTAVTGVITWREKTSFYLCDLISKLVSWYDSSGELHTFLIEGGLEQQN